MMNVLLRENILMSRRFAIVRSALILTFLFAASTVARAADPLFSRTYTVATGSPQTFEATFPIDLADDCDGRSVYLLTAVTGETRNGVASAGVVLNGTDVLSASDFTAAGQTHQRQFAPQASNVLRVMLAGGKPGATLRISIERRIDDKFLDETYVLGQRTAEFGKEFTVDQPAAEYVLVVQRAASHDVPKRFSVRVNDVELANETTFKREAVIRRALTLGAVNRINTSLRGEAGQAVSVSVRRVGDETLCNVAIALSIDSPQTSDVFRQSSIVVRGTAEGPRDLGVAVNGTAAQVDLTHAGTPADPFPWIATVKVPQGAVTLQAAASSVSAREPAEASVAVFVESPDGRAEIAAFPPSGPPPLDVAFSIVTRQARNIARVELDLDGDGVFERSSTTIPENVTFQYNGYGIHEPKVRVTDTSGEVSETSAAVTVESWAQIDAVIQQRWQSFVSFLAVGDIEKALRLLAGERERAKYRPALTAMITDLPRIAADMRTIRPVSLSGGVAHYLLTRTIDGRVHGFRVYFARANDGQWKLVQF